MKIEDTLKLVSFSAKPVDDDSQGGNVIDISLAIKIAEEYAEEMCRNQRKLCATAYKESLKISVTNNFNVILDAPLATRTFRENTNLPLANLIPWFTLKDRKPKHEQLVEAELEWCESKKRTYAILIYGKFDDHNWETADDRSEISHSVDVIRWRPFIKPE